MEKKKIIVTMGNSCIPHELVFEILKHVRAKSLMRFRCVSKSFGSLISEPLFIEAHTKSSVTRFFVNCIGLRDKHIIYNLGQDHLANCPIKYFDEPCFRNLDYWESMNGIVCMWNNAQDVAICNPFMKEHVFIPNPSANKIIGPSIICCSLGFDPTTKKHKVWKTGMVMDTLKLSNWIFTIGVDKSWREVVNFPNIFPSRNDSVCIDGVIYCVNLFGGYIVAFSVGDEKLIQSILFPDGVGKLNTNLEYSSILLEIKGQVALVDFLNFRDKGNICLHVLLNETWVKQTIKLPPELLLYTSFRPSFTANSKGEILSISTCGVSPLFLYYIEREGWRIVDIHETHEREYINESRHTSAALNLVESIWSLR